MKSGSILLKARWVIAHQGPLELFKRTRRYLKKHKLKGFWINRNQANAYKFWLKKESELINEKLRTAPLEIASFSCKPLISIVMPVWNTQANFLEETIASVFEQAYPFWEICIANDASTEPHIMDILNKYREKDARFKFINLTKRGGIVKATNAALNLAVGEFVGFLDHDDLLAPQALLEVVRLINEKPESDVIYSDEDRLIENKRLDPFFKPDWSPDLLLSMNYIGHFLVVRRSLLEKTGGLREETDGSQDHDLILRLSEKTTKIAHIPEILYHWRMTPGSVSNQSEGRERAFDAGLKAIEAALERRGVDGDVYQIGHGRYRVKYFIHGEPLVSIIIPTRDKVDLLRRCIDSIRNKSTYQNYEIIVVDNGSVEPETLYYFQKLKEYGNCLVLDYNEPFNYSKINNFAVRYAQGDYILFLNNDIEVITSNWLEEMLSHCQRTEIGAVGVKLLFPDNSIQHGGIIIGLRGVAGHAFYGNSDEDSGYMDLASVIRNYSAVTAACLMMRKDVLNEVSGFDEKLDVAFNDVDLCLRVIYKGYFILWTPYTVLSHHESASRGYYEPERNIEYFCKKSQGYLDKGDPFYNPNLSLGSSDFQIKM